MMLFHFCYYFLMFKRNFINYTMMGRSRARTQIVPPQDVLDNKDNSYREMDSLWPW